jgi:CHASE3 domain sensor protein
MYNLSTTLRIVANACVCIVFFLVFAILIPFLLCIVLLFCRITGIDGSNIFLNYSTFVLHTILGVDNRMDNCSFVERGYILANHRSFFDFPINWSVEELLWDDTWHSLLFFG